MCVSARYVCILRDTFNTVTKLNEKLEFSECYDNISIKLLLGILTGMLYGCFFYL